MSYADGVRLTIRLTKRLAIVFMMRLPDLEVLPSSANWGFAEASAHRVKEAQET